MTRKKRENTKRLPPIELDLDDDDQGALWEYYQNLTEEGGAANWIRSTLIAALPRLKYQKPAWKKPSDITIKDDTMQDVNEPHYEDIDE